MRRNISKILTAVGLVLLIGAPAVWWLSQPDATVGAVKEIEAALKPSTTTNNAPVGDDEAVGESTPPADSDVGPGGSAEPGPLTTPSLDALQPVPAPTGLRIRSLEIDAPVGSYGIDDAGLMDVPDNVTEVGWYQWGPSPGQPGSAVLAAHVDLAGQGPGVFFDLKTLDPQDLVDVEYDDGSTQTFSVVARATYDKDELPLDIIFSREGPSVLTLITCGGGFDRSSRRYDSNVVVYAVPIDGPTGPIR